MPPADLREPVPAELRTSEFALRPITAHDAVMDHAAVMETREHLRRWEQSSWPEDDFTIEANRADLADLEQRHAAGRAYTYDPLGIECIGCFYVFPTHAAFLTRATVAPLGDDAWADVQAVVCFWARQSRMETGLDGSLLAALRVWFAEAWTLDRTVFVTNEQFTQQVDLVERTDLTPGSTWPSPARPAPAEPRSTCDSAPASPDLLSPRLFGTGPRTTPTERFTRVERRGDQGPEGAREDVTCP